ncbi:unnamed protein product, partial [Brenthis ino]
MEPKGPTSTTGAVGQLRGCGGLAAVAATNLSEGTVADGCRLTESTRAQSASPGPARRVHSTRVQLTVSKENGGRAPLASQRDAPLLTNNNAN